MKVVMKKVNKALADYGKVKSLYKMAFPAEERMPFFLLMYKTKRKGTDFRAVYIDGEWVGLVYLITERDLTYMFYLAVAEEARGKGCGSLILKAVKKKYEGNRIFLALEQLDETSENYAERLNRRRFYEKNGLHIINCRIKEGNMVYDVMCTKASVCPGEYESMMKNYMGRLLCRFVSMKSAN